VTQHPSLAHFVLCPHLTDTRELRFLIERSYAGSAVPNQHSGYNRTSDGIAVTILSRFFVDWCFFSSLLFFVSFLRRFLGSSFFSFLVISLVGLPLACDSSTAIWPRRGALRGQEIRSQLADFQRRWQSSSTDRHHAALFLGFRLYEPCFRKPSLIQRGEWRNHISIFKVPLSKQVNMPVVRCCPFFSCVDF